MLTKYILGGCAILFLALALFRTAGGGASVNPQTRTWFLIGGIFAVVSAYLFYQR